ncbi:hypothetical protein KCU65_g8876, partial [Aureobasidium melanogenum]
MSEPITDDQKQQKQRELQTKLRALKTERNTIVAKYEKRKTLIEAKSEKDKKLIEAKSEKRKTLMDAKCEKEKTLIKAKLEMVKLAKRVTMGKSDLNSCPITMNLLRERQCVKRDLAQYEKYSDSYNRGYDRHKMELQTYIQEFDADLGDILSNLDENLPTIDPHHKIVIKAIFKNARAEGRFFADPADADDLDMDDLMQQLE